jgi:diguanylate cyclase (GGDEF)-like protein
LLVCGLAAVAALAAEPITMRITPDLRVFPQFFSIAQDPARQIYIGGTDGILRYDGGRWIWQESPRPGPVRALHVDARGRVWFGGGDSFGYLESLPTGEQRYVDLAPQFATDLKGEAFSDIWEIAEFDGAIYFRALRHLFKVDGNGKRLAYWHNPDRLGGLAVVRDELWLQWRGEGLRRWSGNAFVAIAGTQTFSTSPVYDLMPLDDGSVLIHDIASGLSLWQQGKVTHLTDPALQADIAHLTHGVALGHGQFAFAGDDGRLRVLDLARRHFDTLPVGVGFMGDVIVDQDGALLAVDDQGAVRLRWPPRWSQYGTADGISGAVHSFALIDDRLFVCGSAGVAETALKDGELAMPPVDRRWTANECWSVFRAGDRLLLAESLALKQVLGKDAVSVSADDLYPRALLVDRQQPTRLWIGTEHGPALLEKAQTGYAQIGRIADTGWRVTTLAHAAQGVWLGSEDNGLALARPDGKSMHGFVVEHWGAEHGLPTGRKGEADVFDVPEGLFVSTEMGLFRFDKNRFVKDDYGGLGALLADGEIVQLQAAGNGDRWAFSFHTVYRKPAGGRWHVALLGRPAIGAFESLLPLPGGDALISSSGVITRYRNSGADAGSERNHATVRVTSVRLNREGRPPEQLPLDRMPHIQPKGGSLDFDLGLSDYDAGDDKQYQVRLDGFSKGWSAWSKQTSYRFFALPPGTYTLRIRARRTYDAALEGPPFRFEIVPRWFERPWLLPLLVLLLSGVIAAALIQRQRLRVRGLRERNLELDRMVHARTHDLELVNLRLQDLADRDGLTGIANRRRFDGFLDQCLLRARERQQPLGLALVDVDHFKRYNDTHGHQAGDEILRQVAKRLTEGVRGDTLVARYGGEEFVLVAPGCELSVMRDLAERLRMQIAASLPGLTVSIGICAFDPASTESAEALVARADAALYRAKDAGRNRVA